MLRNGRGAELREGDPLAASPFIVAAQLDDRKPEAQVFLAAAIDEDDVRRLFADQIASEESVDFDDATGTVLARRVERLGAIVLRESSIAAPSEESLPRGALARDPASRSRDAAVVGRRDSNTRAHGVRRGERSRVARRLRRRARRAPRRMARGRRSPAFGASRRFGSVDLVDALVSLLDWRQRRALDALAPSHVVVPTGSRIPIDYSDPLAPKVAVRIQEVFGLTESPRVLDGRVPVTMQLLSPAHRPVQMTRDLAGFWRTSYFDVRKDLRGRYPRHEWPEDPLTATPTRRAKPRR